MKEETQLLITTKRQFNKEDAEQFQKILEKMTGKRCVIIPEVVSNIIEVSRNCDNNSDNDSDEC